VYLLVWRYFAVWYSVVQCGTVWYSVAQYGTVWHGVAVCDSIQQTTNLTQNPLGIPSPVSSVLSLTK